MARLGKIFDFEKFEFLKAVKDTDRIGSSGLWTVSIF